ncbi:MAG: tRNA (adenosine(37)-N6)-threonylcarbamoyltransferase complex ATPase subunit type 1 TsaE [Ignavibacteria bacterium]|nr:tRNA (adenosine(37)-N6)-threonylcarbamoyltransferase complex ATPase subunit type 1 TsaE [Ignavibacteria bacterium]
MSDITVTEFVRITSSKDETVEFGKEIASNLKSGSVIALYGNLGSGKTTLVKGICEGLGVKENVNSPTFTLINEYKGRELDVYHVDLYRLKSTSELQETGLTDFMGSYNTITLIEWPEIAESILPVDAIKIYLSHSVENENTRWIKLEMRKK